MRSLLVQLVKSLITGYVSQPNEYEYWLPDQYVEGDIPRDLDGTLFRNGALMQPHSMSVLPSCAGPCPDC